MRTTTKPWRLRVAGVTLGAVCAAAVLAPAAGATSHHDTASYRPAPAQDALAWAPCDDADPPFECAMIAVPLDWAAVASGGPAGEQIDIALIRYPADPAVREGALLLNPGGPGGSGYDYARNVAERIDRNMQLDRRFDIIGFDPRGVARSGEVRCLTDADLEFIYYDADLPSDSALLSARTIFDICEPLYGDTLHLYSTENAAHDMDEIRARLGDEQLSFLGVSYGTYLGAVYATLYPERVRAMVLDSGFDLADESDHAGWTFAQALGFEQAFNNWAAWCQADVTCDFHAADVGARWDALLDRLQVAPLHTADGRPIDDVTVLSVTRGAMYDRGRWPVLARALAEAEAGNVAMVAAMFDTAIGRAPDGTYAEAYEPFSVIACSSGLFPPTPDDPDALLEEARRQAPRMSRSHQRATYENDCPFWLGRDMPEPIMPAYDGDAPILVVGGYYDPATPYPWSLGLVERLGPRARLLSYVGEGHGYVIDSTCVTYAEALVLRDRTLPPPYTTCAPDPALARPAYWDTLPVPAGVGAAYTDPTVDYALGYRPGRHYSEVRPLSIEANQAANDYVAALTALGFVHTRTEQPGEGEAWLTFAAPDGSELRVDFLSPHGMASRPRAMAADALIGPGIGVVALVALAPVVGR